MHVVQQLVVVVVRVIIANEQIMVQQSSITITVIIAVSKAIHMALVPSAFADNITTTTTICSQKKWQYTSTAATGTNSDDGSNSAYTNSGEITVMQYNISDNNNNYSNGVCIRGNTESVTGNYTYLQTMTSLGNIDIDFNTILSDLTKRSMYGKDTDLDRVVCSAAGFYWHYENMIDNHHYNNYYI